MVYISPSCVAKLKKSGVLVASVHKQFVVDDLLCITFLFYPLANLTAHEDEKVGLENFELLKVLGTGGKKAPVWFHFVKDSVQILREPACVFVLGLSWKTRC